MFRKVLCVACLFLVALPFMPPVGRAAWVFSTPGPDAKVDRYMDCKCDGSSDEDDDVALQIWVYRDLAEITGGANGSYIAMPHTWTGTIIAPGTPPDQDFGSGLSTIKVWRASANRMVAAPLCEQNVAFITIIP